MIWFWVLEDSHHKVIRYSVSAILIQFTPGFRHPRVHHEMTRRLTGLSSLDAGTLNLEPCFERIINFQPSHPC